MAWKLEIHFSDGSSELVDEDFETEQACGQQAGRQAGVLSPGR